MNRHSCGNKQMPCGCCEGTEALTPMAVANRPGLNAISYRVGTHATFIETMVARLSNMCLGADDECRKGTGNYPLRDLTTRDPNDPSIAMLDGWATIADVLTFYQERIANEGYLRTATERRSILELARLVGYRLRPGVAATTYLALTLENGNDVVIEPYQLKAQSLPGPGELPQTFENIEKLDARARWNRLTPRMSRPQSPGKILDLNNSNGPAEIYLKSISTNLNQNDPLLIVINGNPDLYRVIEVKPDAAADRTLVVIKKWIAYPGAVAGLSVRESLIRIVEDFSNTGLAETTVKALRSELGADRTDIELAEFIENEALPVLERTASRSNIRAETRDRLRGFGVEIGEIAGKLRFDKPVAAPATDGGSKSVSNEKFDELSGVVAGLTKQASVPPANALKLQRGAQQIFRDRSDLGLQAFGAFRPLLLKSLSNALANVTVTQAGTMKVYALRVKAAPFGHNAPRKVLAINQNTGEITNTGEWPIYTHQAKTEEPQTIFLDSGYDKIMPESWVVIDSTTVRQGASAKVIPFVAAGPMIRHVTGAVSGIARAAYGIGGKTTRLDLNSAWLDFKNLPTGEEFLQGRYDEDFKVIRNTVVFAQSEQLELAEEPIKESICGGSDEPIVLDGVYSELESGRWVIVSGERTDLEDNRSRARPSEEQKVRGVKSSELVMLSEVVHDFTLQPGDSVHTRIKLAKKLEYCYTRDSVSIYANVVKATHGETRREVLGGGDGSKALQRFSLRQPPLTYVSAARPSGVESTLKVFVNDVQWREVETIFGLLPADRRFITRASDDEVTTAEFGNGRQGARLPTGLENVRAEYRQGIGKKGNVRAEQITLLSSRPLGVKEVVNPLRASGGADKEGRDQARKNVPIALLALDRLVSTQDYRDFSRTFGGVGKAFASRLSDGNRELVHVTIAGADDIPIDETSDLFMNLGQSLRRFGDPGLPVALAVRELVLLIVSAKVCILPDYVWEKVAPQIRVKMLETFSFENRELGQDALLSEAISAMQSVEGVAYVDVDAFGGVAEKRADRAVRTPAELLTAAQTIVNRGEPNQRVRVNLPDFAGDEIRPAQLAYLSPDVQDTLILNLI